MSEEDDAPQEEADGGLPGWVMTFADLMSLLMCFFVLLLSFSQMDLQKFKKVAGSMEKAFGVQREVRTFETPKGTSVIAKEFSPGRPEPTPFNVVRQHTVDDHYQTLEFDIAKGGDSNADGQIGTEFIKEAQKEIGGAEFDDFGAKSTIEERKVRDAELQAQRMAQSLKSEILDGKVELETFGPNIIIRVLEKGSFDSGSATLKVTFEPVLERIRLALMATPGSIQVAGHTDNFPISTDRFRSNWELSAARAVSVAEELLSRPGINPGRMVVSGHGETRPLFPNDLPKHRAKNRRIEIIIVQAPPDQLRGYSGAPVGEADLVVSRALGFIAFELPTFDEYGEYELYDVVLGELPIKNYFDALVKEHRGWLPFEFILLEDYSFEVPSWFMSKEDRMVQALDYIFEGYLESYQPWEMEEVIYLKGPYSAELLSKNPQPVEF